ncbi:MAG: hypothetical protein AUH29_12100 [Candidatus Rokubacteria bacterium 13_1_40CM_69_27]|nr:MAG: hypothetical protein AUH29_12100 [Candidatus Rokubacteria bacterium 13_1_40CM_69_27]OLC38015.1 MAG: hypothetical protein AUH81_04770 [Candidatus Rokubacteria bacterium 13_1_40CM_4_69_5]OLE36938.1 MAG: hypothetical protein AUG00_09415 [Candidatus Rokubacteria bacterium 13_1_20CM_2_70_7]
MKQLTFALQFKGNGAPVPGSDNRLRAKTIASSQALKAVLGATGVQATVEPMDRTTAVFESEVQITGQGTFIESGSIAYGTAGQVAFKTVGQGIIGPSGMDDLQRGAVIWEVTAGDGQFAGATGLITSNFTLTGKGEVVDNQFAQLFVK